jgi:predicted hydrocarbon binding protein
MEIKNKAQRDSVTELPMVEAYMRWALMAAEAEMGDKALELCLRENGLERFIGHYPPEELNLSTSITVGDYANLCAGLMQSFGSDGKSRSIQVGRISTKPALEKQAKLFNFASRTAIKFLPLSLQIRTVLETIQSDLDKIYKADGYKSGIKIEDRGNKWAYSDESCAVCAGKEANAPICWSWVGTLEEALGWLTGKQFEIDQVECRAMGASACVWEISKTAKK